MIRKEGNAILSEPSLNIKSFLDEEKRFYEKSSSFPNQNEFTKIQGIGLISNQDYVMDINRKRCTLNKITYQNRVLINVNLLRLDIDNKPHTNPDGKKISGTHLHVYREDCGDAWAYELTDPYLQNIKPGFNFPNLVQSDFICNFYEFSRLCNFTNRVLFATFLSM